MGIDNNDSFLVQDRVHYDTSPDFVLAGGLRRGPKPSPDFVLAGARLRGRLSSPPPTATAPDFVRGGGRLCSAAPLDLDRFGALRVESCIANNISLDF